MIYVYCQTNDERQNIDQFCRSKHLSVNSYENNLDNLLSVLQPDDSIICSDITSINKSILTVMDVLQTLMVKNVKLLTVNDGYEIGDKLIYSILAYSFGLTVEIGRKLISQRTKEGLIRAKQNGKVLGRRRGSHYRMLTKCENYIRDAVGQGVPKTIIANNCGCCYTTLHRFVKEKGFSKF